MSALQGAGSQSMTNIREDQADEGVRKLFAELDVTYERLGIQNRQADLAPERKQHFD